MEQLGIIFAWVLRAWLGLLAVMLVWRMLSGGILMRGLLSRKRSEVAGLDRMQLLFVTLFFAGAYAVTALAGGYHKILPDVPMPLLLILVGSNGAYLTSKYAGLLGRSAEKERP